MKRCIECYCGWCRTATFFQRKAIPRNRKVPESYRCSSEMTRRLPSGGFRTTATLRYSDGLLSATATSSDTQLEAEKPMSQKMAAFKTRTLYVYCFCNCGDAAIITHTGALCYFLKIKKNKNSDCSLHGGWCKFDFGSFFCTSLLQMDCYLSF